MGAFHNLRLVSHCQILYSNVFPLSILGTVYYYNGILKRVGHENYSCDFGGFEVLNRETEDFFLIGIHSMQG